MVRICRESEFILQERVCWVKANAIPVASRSTHLIPEWEPIYVFRRGAKLAYFGRDSIRRPYAASTIRRVLRGYKHSGKQGRHTNQAHPYVRGEKAEAMNLAGRDAPNVIWAAPEQRRDWPHPARFPEAIPEFLIQAYCPPDGTVLDPFVGSGTTCVVSARLGRDSIGIDLQPVYVEMARRRVQPYVSQLLLDFAESLLG